MIISLWNYLRGYVIIEAEGFSVERLINLAVRRGAYIWGVCRDGDAVKMRASVQAFNILEECAQKTGSRLRVAEERGLPFVLRRYGQRTFLLAGVAIFVVTLYALSLFVWRVDVSGCERLRLEDVTAFLEEQGLRVGAFKGRMDTKSLEQKLLNRFGDIGWVDVHIKGTRARVSLNETIPPQVIVDRKTPCDIVAAKDGLIVSVATSAGTPLAKPGDVVNAGDVLVKSELIVKSDETGDIRGYVHADAQVMAKLYYEINLDIPFEYEEKRYTGETRKGYGLILFGNSVGLPAGGTPFENSDVATQRFQLSFGEHYPLPVILVTTVYRQYEPDSKTRTLEQSKELAERLVTGRIIREFDFSADVIEKQFHFSENADRILVKCIVVTIENIGREQMAEPPVAPPPVAPLE